MKQMEITQFVFMQYQYPLDKNGKADYTKNKCWFPEIWGCRVDDNENRQFIGTQTFVVNIPADFNPIPQQVAALERQKAEALDMYQRTVAEINERLSKLQAITCDEVPA